MTVDHLPTSPVELPELPDHDEEGGNAETATRAKLGQLPKAQPSADATEAEWPQTGFGSFP